MTKGKGSKKKEPSPPPTPKEKKQVSLAQIRADDKAAGQEGKALAAAIRGTYGWCSVVSRRSKAQISEEFHARNALEAEDAKAQENQ